jgi:hypothetical protein
MRTLLSALFLSMSLASAARADEGIQGYWEGELAGQTVAACFGSERGGYVYASRGELLTLEVAGNGSWLEKPLSKTASPAVATGVWFDLARDGDELTGRWKPTGAGATQPIRLRWRTSTAHERVQCSFEIATPEFEGVWKGELGGKPVVACLDAEGSGRYYYLAHGHAIELRAQPGHSWLEGPHWKSSGRWTSVRANADRLSGEWLAAQGDRRAAIALARIAPLAADEACEYELPQAYLAPRRAAMRIDTGPAITERGVAVRKLGLHEGEVSVLQLADPDAAGERINAALREEFEQSLTSHYDCAEFLWRMDTLEHADARWLVVRKWVNWECGGPYPGAESYAVTFDRLTGEAEETPRWVGDEFAVADGLAAKIAQRVIGPGGSRADEPDDGSSCREAWQDARSYLVWPSDHGVTFSPGFPHVIQACIEEVELPLAEVEPFLTPAGRAALLPATR